jgi:S1-C subfamily serine protease
MTTSYEAGPLLDLSNGLAGAVDRAGGSTVAVYARNRLPSSGVVWRQGVVVTAAHTVERDKDITVGLPDGSTAQATLAGQDATTDIAVLRVEGNNLPAADLGDSSALRVGHLVLAVARPGNAGLSATLGSVSAVGGSWRTWAGGRIDSFIRPDLTLYPGFSGGPLVDAEGKVVGLSTSGLSRGMPVALPTSTVNRVVEQLLTRGRIARGYLGVGMQPVQLPESQKQALNLPSTTGLIVVSLESGSPAEAAGMLVGDVLVALGDHAISDPRDVQSLLDAESVGTTITARVVRGGSVTEIPVKVGERPQRGE